MPSDPRLLQFTETLLATRLWSRQRLGTTVTPVMFDLMCVVARHSLRGTPVGVKELTVSLPYSDAGIRKALRQCVDGQWIRMDGIPRDGRVRVLHAQPRLLEFLREYDVLLTSALTARH